MAYPQPLRKILGISVADYATLINCTPGQVSMAQSGNRSLPSASTEVVSLLYNLAEANGSSIATAKITDERTLALLKRNHKARKARLNGLLVKQEKSNTQLQQLQLLLLVAPLAAASPTVTGMDDTMLQLQILQRKAQKKLKACQLQLAQLYIAIAGINAEIGAAKEWL